MEILLIILLIVIVSSIAGPISDMRGHHHGKDIVDRYIEDNPELFKQRKEESD